jgi:hypothetical protein
MDLPRTNRVHRPEHILPNRGLKPAERTDDTEVGPPVLVTESLEHVQAATAKGSATGTVSRKPSERFTRKAIEARSRASKSERVRVADLVEKLGQKMDTEANPNCRTKFSGYKPGKAGPP